MNSGFWLKSEQWLNIQGRFRQIVLKKRKAMKAHCLIVSPFCRVKCKILSKYHKSCVLHKFRGQYIIGYLQVTEKLSIVGGGFIKHIPQVGPRRKQELSNGVVYGWMPQNASLEQNVPISYGSYFVVKVIVNSH